MPTQKSPIAFQGRKTSRSSSEQRRLAILKATLRIVVRDGVRGVRHRAVATEADVPLSATTYYFKDIHDLLADAFTLYAKETMETFVDPFWTRANERLSAFPAERWRRPEVMQEILEAIAELGTDYIFTRVTVHRDQLVMEYAFWYAALTDDRMHQMALQHGRRLLGNFTQVLERFGANEAELGAKSILGTVRRLEYEGMLTPPEMFTRESVKKALLHQIRAVLAV